LPRLGKNVLFGLVCAALSWVILLAALQAGLRLSLEGYLSPLARVASLDYLLSEGGIFGSLREGFVANVLGLDPRTPSDPQAADAAPSSAPAPADSGGFSAAPGRPARTVVEEPLDNDEFSKAYTVERIPFTAKTDSSSATRQPDEPSSCQAPVRAGEDIPLLEEPDEYGLGVGGGTLWFRYQPKRDLGLVASTFGSASTTVELGVYTGAALPDLKQVVCDVDPYGNAQVTFPGKADAVYFFRVAAPTGGGRLVFSLDPLGRTELVSVAWDGTGAGNSFSAVPSVSADGRYVAFLSYGSNMVENDTNSCEGGNDQGHCPDVFVRDMHTDRTELVSVTSEGEQRGDSDLDGGSWNPSISGTGRFVAFVSAAPLVANDRNGAVDVFVHDRDHDRDGRFDEHHPGARYTERVSISTSGQEGRATDAWRSACQASAGGGCWFNDHYGNVAVSISSDGRYVVFSSDLHGLVDGVRPCTDTSQLDTEGAADYGPPAALSGVDSGVFGCRQIYVRDRREDETFLASASTTGDPANADSSSPYVSKNGRWVAFASSASNLAPVVEADGSERPDANGVRDAFVHHLRTGRTELISLSTEETQGDLQSGGIGLTGHVTVSNDGRWVAFISEATNLSEEDDDPLFDVFLRDRKKGETVLVSKGADDHHVSHASISADGRYIALTSHSGEPLESDLDRPQNLLVWDRKTDTGTIVSVATTGEEANGPFSHEPEISGSGRFVVFHSDSTNLDKRDSDSAEDIYIHELPWIR
jgi:Tol biopolymer transport system component